MLLTKTKQDHYGRALKAKLGENDSDSSDQSYEIREIMSNLIPVYYTYRRYLLDILKETNANPKLYATLALPEQFVAERLKKCKQEHELNSQLRDQRQQSKVSRTLVTEKVLEKHRKKLKQNKELLKKYEEKQIAQMLGRNKSSQLIEEQHTFEMQNAADFQKQDQIVEASHESVHFDESEASISNHEDVQIHKDNKNANYFVKNTQYLSRNVNTQEQPRASKNIGQKMKNKEVEEYQECIQKDLKKQTVKQQDYSDSPVPNIRITSIKNEKKNQFKSESDDSQDDFSSIRLNPKHANNLVEVDHDDTYSEHKPRVLIRQNTPNFDSHSQKARPNDFFNLQKKKLEEQRLHANRIQEEVSMALGEDEQSSASHEFINEGPNMILGDLDSVQQPGRRDKSTGRLSARESLDQFLYSVRCVMAEICELNSRAECLKFMLKNKQYEVLTKIYAEDIGKGPIFSKLCMKNIQDMLVNSEKSQVAIILNKIFKGQAFVSFQDFGNSLNSILTQNQFSILNSKDKHLNIYEINAIVSKLFSIWLQLSYFEQKLKKITQVNSIQLGELCTKLTQSSNSHLLDNDQIEQFLYSSSKNRINGLKIIKLLTNYFPTRRFKDMEVWLTTKQANK